MTTTISNRFRMAALAAVPLLLAAAPAWAAPLKYTFSGAVNGSFTFDPAVNLTISASSNAFRGVFANPTGDMLGFGDQFAMYDSSQPRFGGVNLGLNNGTGFFGAPLFSGAGTSPTLLTGTFALVDTATSASSTLVVGPGAPAPELGGGVLAALAGLLALGFARLRGRVLAG